MRRGSPGPTGSSQISWAGSVSFSASAQRLSLESAKPYPSPIGNRRGTIHVAHKDGVVLRLAPLFLEEDHLSVRANVAQVAKIEPGQIALGPVAPAGYDHATPGDALFHKQLRRSAATSCSRNRPGTASGIRTFPDRLRA